MGKSILKNNLLALGMTMVASITAIEASAMESTSQQKTFSSYKDDGQFLTAYVDQSGLSWSVALQGRFSNGCADAIGRYSESKCTFEIDANKNLQVKVDDSMAAKSCREIGARLPTKTEIESLIRNFDHTEMSSGPKLTELGRSDMQAKFSDDIHSWIWSSSVWSFSHDRAYIFSGDDGAIFFGVRQLKYDNAVRCVH
ncbi:hypothetical protein D3C87_90310 [compost metagenome]